ncbi:MAG: isocitrate lyase/phosphoenolpyruvate mutase family protein [Xenococcaceae cyanobacterium MO_167.B27]|nr:isocitrate lyase/phosphoenolpyruvate mutase family protein [Xenococcaceae cyanobacterium MO_167.B27]
MNLKQELANREIIPFIGVYDVFFAAIAGKYYDGIFISSFSFAASYYGLPDIGFIAWSDIVAFVQRVKTILPNHLILVDIDDGYKVFNW